MLKVIIVAGNLTSSLADNLDIKEYEVVRMFDTVDLLWSDILSRGSSSYLDIDKIIVIGSGFLTEDVMTMEEQLLNIQSTMEMEDMKSTLYFVIKDADLYKKVQDNQGSYITYRNFNMLIFKEVNIRNFEAVLKGNYDAKGLYHQDFLRKNEIDAKLLESEHMEEEDEVVEPEIVEFTEYADTEENKKEIRKRELEERRNKRRNAKKNPTEDGLLGKILKGGGSSKAEMPIKSKGLKDLYRGVIAVTGDRQSGVTTTASNMAQVYANNGYSVLIIDLDINRRMQTIINPNFKEAVELDSRVSQGLLVSLINPTELENVYSVVSNNVAVISIANDVERDIKRFANKPFDKVFSSSNLVTLFSFAKSLFDVVIVDIPWEKLDSVGSCLSYVDRVVLCVPNTAYHLDNILEVELGNLFNREDFVAHNLLSKSKILLTKYNSKSKFGGREMTPKLVNDTLASLEESIYHIEVVGKVSYVDNYEAQFERGNKIVNYDNNIKKDFESFMVNL